jgi:hypothetical protein
MRLGVVEGTVKIDKARKVFLSLNVLIPGFCPNMRTQAGGSDGVAGARICKISPSKLPYLKTPVDVGAWRGLCWGKEKKASWKVS